MSTFSKSKSTSSSSNSNEDVDQLRRGPWTSEEDKALVHYVASHGEGQWNLLAKRSGLKRNGKSCRLRWLNYLKPDVKRGNLTPREQLLILELHSKWGNRWSKIARRLPGRTDNEIKNYWRSRVQKQARHLKIDTNSSAFEEMIRGIWMPMLVQKVQGSSISFDLPSQNSVAQEVPSQVLSTTSSSTSFDLPSQNSVAQEVPSQVLSTTSSDSSTSPGISNSGHSINIPEYFPYIEGTTNPVYATGINANTDNYDITNFSLPITSTEYSEFQYPTTHSLTENNWTDYMDDESFWDMDEFWQFR